MKWSWGSKSRSSIWEIESIVSLPKRRHYCMKRVVSRFSRVGLLEKRCKQFHCRSIIRRRDAIFRCRFSFLWRCWDRIFRYFHLLFYQGSPSMMSQIASWRLLLDCWSSQNLPVTLWTYLMMALKVTLTSPFCNSLSHCLWTNPITSRLKNKRRCSNQPRHAATGCFCNQRKAKGGKREMYRSLGSHNPRLWTALIQRLELCLGSVSVSWSHGSLTIAIRQGLPSCSELNKSSRSTSQT